MSTTEIMKGDKVVWLYDYKLELCEVLKVNKKSIKVRTLVRSLVFSNEVIKNVPRHKLAHVNDKFTVVWDLTKGANGRGSYRIDYNTYPDQNAIYHKWSQPYDYVVEE